MPINWLGNGVLVLASIVCADIWKTTPFIALLALAGLQNIPQTLYESASIDGAVKFRQFISITLPLVLKVFLLAVLLRTLDAFFLHVTLELGISYEDRLYSFT